MKEVFVYAWIYKRRKDNSKTNPNIRLPEAIKDLPKGTYLLKIYRLGVNLE